MSGIDKVECWYDIKYTDNSTEIPPKGHNLSTPDIILEGTFNPSKNREFSEIRLELPFTQALNITYLRLTYNFNNGDDQVFYAWVDDVKLMSDTENAPMVNILYHIDLWRTYNQYFTYGSGFVVRRPSEGVDYPQNYPFIYKQVSDTQELVKMDYRRSTDDFPIWWAIVSYNRSENDQTRTTLAIFPISRGLPNLVTDDDVVGGYKVPNVLDFIEARFDERMGIKPHDIQGVWLSPIFPLRPSYGHDVAWSTDGGKYRVYADNVKERRHDWTCKRGDYTYNGKTGWYEVDAIDTNAAPIQSPYTHVQYNLDLTPSETEQYIITGFNGETLGALPYGMHITSVEYRFINTVTNAYIELRFNDGIKANSEGLTFVVNLPSFNVNENAWSEYFFSGEREYDIRMRFLNTLSGGIASGLSQGAMGGLLGYFGNVGTAGEEGLTKALTKVLPFAGALGAGPAGAIAGAVVGAGTSLLGAGSDLILSRPFQDVEDYLHAHQSNGMLFTGNGVDIYYDGQPVMLYKIVPNPKSVENINNIKEVQGVKYNIPVSDCNELINNGGPMQITNLIVHGNAPITAKQWVQNKFAKGVRIVER